MNYLTDEVDIKTITTVAGRFEDGRSLSVALIFGAEGIQLGLHFVVNELNELSNYKNSILDAEDLSTLVTGLINIETSAEEIIFNYVNVGKNTYKIKKIILNNLT